MKSIERKKVGWYAAHQRCCNQVALRQAEVILLGDSLVANLCRYPDVWSRHFKSNVVNCGIGGDSTRNVLWRVERMYLPATVSVGIIHCGINDISGVSTAYGPTQIASNIIMCGSTLQERHPWMSIIVVGILPAEETFSGRNTQIAATNSCLKELCSRRGFQFIDNGSSNWRDGSGSLDQSLFWKDGLHLR